MIMTKTISQPCFVLVRPQMGENIGAAARAMCNFGLKQMRVVAPRDGWPSQRAIAMASGAGSVLDQASHYKDIAAAIGDNHFTFATTARKRDLTKQTYSPKNAMLLAFKKILNGEKVSILFGPERSGLENQDIAQANAIISVPVNPEFPSLNLAQCALLLAYEWRLVSVPKQSPDKVLAQAQLATVEEVERLALHFEDSLDHAGFFFPRNKEEKMKVSLRNMWSRFPMTKKDIQIFYGILRQLVRWRGNDL